jgi:glycosyltransferase XagB
MAGISQGRSGPAYPVSRRSPAGVFSHDSPSHLSPRHDDSERFARLLPPELAFLIQPGLSAERLLSAVSMAPRGVTPLEAVLAEGLVPEERYYDALARHLGCWRYAGEPGFAPGFDPVRSLDCEVAALEGGLHGPRAVIAPGGGSVAGLIEMTMAGRIAGRHFAIASPHRLASLIRMRAGGALLDAAVGRLPERLSARGGPTGWQIGAGVLAVTALVMLGWARPAALGAALAISLWTFFLAAIGLRSVAAVADNSEPRPPLLGDEELPVYTVVVAAYREAAVVTDLVKALDALDYPSARLDIRIVVEARDSETLARLASLQLPPRYEVIVAPPGAPSTKPRALNIALASARGELLVVYDAEDAPAPDQLRRAASRFAADTRLDCLQARLTIRNSDDSWLSKLFALEYAALFDLVNPGLCALDLPLALGGTSNHFRVEALVEAGGWDSWNVAEDADLGVRLARAGFRLKSLDSDTSEEAPHELGNWFRQRVRWQKGWMQTCIVHSRAPRELMRALGVRRGLSAAVLVLGSVVSALFWPVFAFDTIRRAVEAASGVASGWREAVDLFTYVLALAGVWAIVIPAFVAARQRRLKVGAGALMRLPVYYLLVSAAAWAAIYDVIVRPHYWAKTAHGRTRPATRPVLLSPAGRARVGRD